MSDQATWRVLKVFMEDPARHRYGIDLCKQARLGSGSIYPTLAVLERDGWVESDWEQVDASRPPRRGYRLTTAGIWRARQLLAEGEEPAGRWRRLCRWVWFGR